MRCVSAMAVATTRTHRVVALVHPPQALFEQANLRRSAEPGCALVPDATWSLCDAFAPLRAGSLDAGLAAGVPLPWDEGDAMRSLFAGAGGVIGRGIVLRFGPIDGAHTSLGAGGSLLEQVRRRRGPIVGQGEGRWSFCHVRLAEGLPWGSA